jgi:DNA helicase-2/ATP-dependent DNA helicase PcrA
VLDLGRLSAEQRRAVLAADGPLLVEAGPGSGKTTVLAARVAYLIAGRGVAPASVLALTFTGAAARELRSRLHNLLGDAAQAVTVATLHALGLRIVRQWSAELGLGPGPVAVYDAADARALLGRVAKELGIDADRVPFGVLARDVERFRLGESPTSAEPVPTLARAYEELLARRGAVDYTAMLALPLRLLAERPSIRRLYQDAYRHVVCDEAQDLSAGQYALVHALAERHRNVVLVGDRMQCVPSDTPVQTPDGEVPINTLRVGDAVLAAGGRGQVTTASVRGVLTRAFRGELVRVTLGSGRILRLTPGHMCFARLGLSPSIHYVYLMHRRGFGYRVGIAAGVRRDSETGALVSGLLARTAGEQGDKTWILRACSSRAEALFHEQLLSVRYGVPTAVFRAEGALQVLDQDAINRLFAAIDTRANAARLMADLGIHEDHPHHRPQAHTIGGEARRLQVHLAMFGSTAGSARSPWRMHRVWFNSSDSSVSQELERRGLRTRRGARGTWRVERHARSLAAAVALSEALKEAVGGVEIARWAKLTEGRRFAFHPASQLHASMVLPVLVDGHVVEDGIVSVEREPYAGPVYDLNVEHVHNYCASGVVVHNCLYGWRGAEGDYGAALRRDFPDLRTLALRQNFRSTGRIVALANALGAGLGAGPGLWTANPPGEKARLHAAVAPDAEAAFVASTVERLCAAAAVGGPGDAAVLFRTNEQAEPLAAALRARGMRYRVRGGGDLFGRREVRDALAYLRLTVDASDHRALARIVDVPPRRLGRLAEVLRARPAPLAALPALAARFGAAHLAAAERFVAFLEGLRAETAGADPATLLDVVLECTGYRTWLAGQADGPERLVHLASLRGLAARAGRGTAAWLAEVADDDDGDDATDDRRVVLSTIHRSKGGEWRTVFVTGLEEGLLPHVRALDRGPAASPALADELKIAYLRRITRR